MTPEMLGRLSPFRGFDVNSLAQAASLAKREDVPRSLQALAYPWEHQVVYLLKGELNLAYADGCKKVIVGGCDEALTPLARGGVGPASVRAITDAELLCFDEKALDIFVTWDQLVQPAPRRASRSTAAGEGAADWRSMAGLFEARRLMHRTFASLPPAHIESLLACFRRQAVMAGEVVVRQGEPGDYYYVIEHGRAQVVREVGGVQVELAELKAGDTFGEEALVAEAERNATVSMKTDGELLRLAKADFVSLLREPLLQRVSASEALRRVAAGACWLDVRFPAEYRQDGLPGALNVPLNELRDALPNLAKNQEYIVYCQSGRRSSAAVFLLSQRGLQASLLDGGLKAMTTVEKVAA